MKRVRGAKLAKQARCAKCDNRGWFQDGDRRFRCAMCYRLPDRGLGRLELEPGPDPKAALEALSPGRGRPLRSYEARLQCQAEACLEKTTHDKPYCVRHIALMPYPAQVLAVVAQAAMELEAAASGKRVSPTGIKASEIAIVLARVGQRYIRRLAVDVEIVRLGRPRAENQDGQLRLWVFLRAMKKAGLVKVSDVVSCRGGTRVMVDLTKRGRVFAEEALEKLSAPMSQSRRAAPVSTASEVRGRMTMRRGGHVIRKRVHGIGPIGWGRAL